MIYTWLSGKMVLDFQRGLGRLESENIYSLQRHIANGILCAAILVQRVKLHKPSIWINSNLIMIPIVVITIYDKRLSRIQF